MRKLKTADLFGAMRVVKAAGVKEEIKRIALEVNEKKEVNQNEVGAELILSIIEGLANQNAEKLMYEFLAGPFEMDADQIGEMPIAELINKIKELGKLESQEGWSNFFKSLGDLIR